MAKFLYLYYGGNAGDTDEERAKTMKDWKAWAGKMGKALADFGSPTGDMKVVTKAGAKNGDPQKRNYGYSFVEADDLDAAVKLANGHPHFNTDSTIEVYEAAGM